MRFSFLPLNSIVPRRYRCQPDLAVTAALTAADVPKGSLSNFKRLAITAAVQARRAAGVYDAALRPAGLWSARQLLPEGNSHRARKTNRRWARSTTSSRRSAKVI